MSNNLQDRTHSIKKISILGCGWFGMALAKKLVALDYQVKGSTTSPDKLDSLSAENIDAYLVNFTAEEIQADPLFFEADVLFICIPPKRNSAELKDYPEKIRAILNAAKTRTRQVVIISSTSVFADENQIVDENSATTPDTDSGKMILAAEQILKEEYPSNATIIRFAGLIGPDRNAGRFFAGKKNIPNGLAPVNLIHQKDAVGIAISIIQKQAFGRTYHACAPNHPVKQNFYTNAAKDSGLIEPEFIEEKKAWKIVESVHIVKYLGYEFEVGI